MPRPDGLYRQNRKNKNRKNEQKRKRKMTENTQTKTEKTIAERVADMPYWYHKIDLGFGVVTPGWSPVHPDRYCIPQDLTGKRVLDIGSWDGYWTWEALKWGAAEVVAIDDFSDNLGALKEGQRTGWETFDLCAEAFGFECTEHTSVVQKWFKNNNDQKCSRCEMNVYDISEELMGRFDVVFFFGTIYHLKHPLLALEKISDICDGSLHIETASLDEYSPYRGGIGGGFNRNEHVMEFYPDKEYGSNKSNWWAPTLECLGAMMRSVGFVDIDCWPLMEDPKELCQCRGFASGTKDANVSAATRPDDAVAMPAQAQMKVAAVMSVPRLGFTDNMTCASSAFWPMRIPIINVQGAFWGQCLERGMEQIIDAGVDVILTVDYDTAFKKSDVESVLRLMHDNPDISAVVPVQKGRGNMPVLMSMKTRSGQMRKDIPITELAAETTQIASGHFGLTAIRVKDLLEIQHPWFISQPNADGKWGPGRVDDDIYFWKLMEKNNKKVVLANRVTIGHMQLMVTWPDEDLKTIYQSTSDFHDNGKPKNVWK